MSEHIKQKDNPPPSGGGRSFSQVPGSSPVPAGSRSDLIYNEQNSKKFARLITCNICHRGCTIKEGEAGACRARGNRAGKNIPLNYGVVTSLALDPIEKKPLKHFYPGSMILSTGSFGCNLFCPFCQNHSISRVGEEIRSESEILKPEELSDMALSLKDRGNIGVAFTYNEPMMSYEFIRDTGALVRAGGMKNVVVTNGSVSLHILREVLPVVDAMNIDLKGFSEASYQAVSGDLSQTLEFIEEAHKACHIELTSLIVPGINDSREEMEREAAWIAGLDENIPLHITRFFPMYKYRKAAPTDKELLFRFRDIALSYLKNVYIGNV